MAACVRPIQLVWAGDRNELDDTVCEQKTTCLPWDFNFEMSDCPSLSFRCMLPPVLNVCSEISRGADLTFVTFSPEVSVWVPSRVLHSRLLPWCTPPRRPLMWPRLLNTIMSALVYSLLSVIALSTDLLASLERTRAASLTVPCADCYAGK